jgi:hypothetical protein
MTLNIHMNKHHKLSEEQQEQTIDLANDRIDAIFFAIIFVIVLLLIGPSMIAKIPRPFACSQYNNDYAGCVNSQISGKGCAWYATCKVCAKSGTKIEKVCR